jgi:Carboxypeptidase regulatory-like domain/Putative zinc-finger
MSEHLHPDPDTLSAFVEGVLPEHERAQCLAHLADCSRCREIVFLAQDTPAAPVLGAIPIRRRLPMPLLAAAAAVCFAVLGIWFYLRSKTEAPLPEQVAHAIVTPPPPEVQQPKPVGEKTAPRVPLRRVPEPVPPTPSPTPVPTPEVARAAPPPVNLESASVSAPTPPPPPARTFQLEVAPVALSGISGIVTDPTGAVISRATVELREVAGNGIANAQSDASGNFKFTGLTPGRYELRVTSAGFRLNSQQVEVTAEEMAAVTSTLQVGSAAETVEVQAASSMIQTESSSVSRRKQAAPPRPLPSKLPADTTVTRGKIMLSVDSSGALFYSGNSGKSWKAVKPLWAGKITDLIAPPDVPEPGSAQFQLTIDSGADWLSRDGRRWYAAPAPK